jgi:UDP-N-acetylglucosamine 2-epimerase
VVGARPQFVKAAAVSAAIDETSGVDEVVVHTGQHYDTAMSDVFFDDLQMRPPSHHLAVGSGGHGKQTGLMLERLEPVVVEERPDLVLTYGDTNSTLAAAIVASKLLVPIAHVEAGLRSYDRSMPEEVNRVVTDHLSAQLFCPSQRSVANLAAEGITDHVHEVGDVMCDVFLRFAQLAATRQDRVKAMAGIADAASYALMTMHRPYNTDEPERMQRIMAAIETVVGSGQPVVWPVHPRMRDRVARLALPAGLHLVDPLGYLDMIALLTGAAVLVTDSGGLQKEAYWAGVPCVTMRDSTEWTETVDEGWNRLVDADTAALVEAVEARSRGVGERIAYGDGTAAQQIVTILAAG